MQDFRKLVAWQKAHQLTLRLYQVSKTFPREEQYGLTSQLRRAGQSIATNIAEGCGRGTGADMARFLQMAMGSASEVEYELLLARDLSYLSNEAFAPLDADIGELKRVLTGLLKRVRSSPSIWEGC